MRKLALLFPFSLCISAMLSGCGIDRSTTDTTTQGTLALTGLVHGGQQPIYQATIQLYTVGATGNGSAATPMISQLVQTDANGFFSLDSVNGSTTTFDYSCAHPNDQVYIVATGGQASIGTNNPALVMMDALGNCGNLSASSFITINEITTAAAAWALAPFVTSYTHVGASATNSVGIANAFLDAALLADPGLGAAATLPSNLSVEPGKLYALADILAGCVNSDGGLACTPLFSAAKPTNGSTPTNTLDAALDIVRNPGQNPTAVFNAMPSIVPFPTTLSLPPNDWTITLTVTGGGINSPTALGIDSIGTVWVGNYYGVLSEFSPQGTPLSATGYGSGVLNEVYGLTVDSYDNVWVANEQSSPNGAGSVSKFRGASSGSPGSVVMNGGYTSFWDSSIDFPIALSSGANGEIFTANYANSSSTSYDTNGNVVNVALGGSVVSFPTAVAADANGGVWIGSFDDTTITHVDQNGNVLSNPACCFGSNGLATDAYGNAWVSNYYNSTFSEVSATGNTLLSDVPLVTSPQVSYPAGVSVDAGQNVWFTNYRGESISEVSGAASTTPGTVLSPADGFGYSGPPPASPLLLLPYSIVPDRSGNIWVSNFGNDNLIMFFGIATPTATPVRPTPVAP